MTATTASQSDIRTAPAAEVVQPARPQSRWVAAVLHLFLAPFGAADFYLGHVAEGIVRVATGVIAWVFCFEGMTMLATGADLPDDALGIEGVWLMLLAAAIFVVWTVWQVVTLIRILARSGIYATDRNGNPDGLIRWLVD